MNRNRFKSTFYSAILFYSRFNPEKIAVIFGTQEVTYAEFARDIERATRQLASRIPSRSGLGMVSLSHPYLHWVLTIALGRIGMATVTAYDPVNSPVLDLIKPDLVFIDPEVTSADTRFVKVTDEWMGRDADKLPPFVDPEHQADAPFRLILSSGTTGRPKKILLTHALFKRRVQGTALGAALQGSSSRTLALVGIDTAGGYQLPMTTWFLGGQAVLPMPGENPYRTITSKDVTYVLMAPVQLEQILRSMPAGAWPNPGLTVIVGGSSLPRLLSEKARARLTPSVLLLYGSTEAGMIARAHASIRDGMDTATGLVQPDVEVQIVDSSGNVLPHGEVGEVRVWCPDCVSGYVDAESAGIDSEETFRDGWFYPGDAGVLSGTGMLTIVGRTKELMNLGGVKVSPNAIEEALAACPGVTDIAAFSLEHEGGVATPWVVVVRGAGYDQTALANRFKQVFPNMPAVKFVHADVIPRNQMGKIQRNVIRDHVQQTLGQIASST